MPNSKAYTSNKVNGLLESEILEGMNDLERTRLKDIFNSLFGEVMKVSLSLLVTTLINMYIPLKKGTVEDSEYELRVIAVCLVVFIFVYLLLNIISIMVVWLFDAIFNIRILSSEKKKASLLFHKKIINYIYMATSFETEYRENLKKVTGNENDLYLDLAVNSLAQAVYYFKISKMELHKLLPPRGGENGKRRRKDADFLGYVGYPWLNTSIITAQRSLRRLLNTKADMEQAVEEVKSNANIATIKEGLSNSIGELFQEIKIMVTQYETELDKILNLQEAYVETIEEMMKEYK